MTVPNLLSRTLELPSSGKGVDDDALWTPTDYGPDDSTANRAPALPGDFIRNDEAEEMTA